MLVVNKALLNDKLLPKYIIGVFGDSSVKKLQLHHLTLKLK